MKKLYLLTFGLLCGSLVGMAEVTNVTTNVSYGDDLKAAYDAASSGDVIEITSSVSVADRLLGAKTVTFVGVGENVTIINTKNTMIAGVNGGNTLTFKNLILTSSQSSINNGIELGNGGANVLNLENVTLKGINTASANGYFNIMKYNGNTVNLTNVKVEDCTCGASFDIKAWRGVKINLTGDNSLSIGYSTNEGAPTITVVDGITNTTPIKVYDVTEAGTKVISGYTDASKFELVETDLKLVAEDGNLVAKAQDPVLVETPDFQADGVSGVYYQSLTEAITAVVNYNVAAGKENMIPKAVITLNRDQVISSRLNVNDCTVEIVGAEGKDITVESRVGNNTISVLVNVNNSDESLKQPGNITFKNLTIAKVGGNNNDRQHFECTSGGVLTLENVVVKDFMNSKSTVIRVTNGGLANLISAQFENCMTVPAEGDSYATTTVFYGASGSRISGNTNASFEIEDNYNVNAEGWTPVDVMDVTFTHTNNGTRNAGTVVLLNFTDVDKLNLTNGDEYDTKLAVGTEENANNIMAVSTVNTGVDDVMVEEANGPVEYFNLQGVKVENPANGLYIKRQGNKVSKVLVK